MQQLEVEVVLDEVEGVEEQLHVEGEAEEEHFLV